MGDVVEWLVKAADEWSFYSNEHIRDFTRKLREAADEIERLRKENAELKGAMEYWKRFYTCTVNVNAPDQADNPAP